ncbi:Hsp70 family protein [Nocardia veterana]|uniref:Hsp70 family protein n=1 Tax=Nocardia veterana TaxID=132249 RepID=A0A7X6RGZ2_9NOCA|nr:Hsp70 family protein [Nocardia veterana]NKY85627.1 Hsp70 family protein [Nocardia veterana]
MTQGLTLGITVGSSRTVAATGATSASADPENVSLHIRRRQFDSAPELSENLLSRVGDPVDILLPDGSSVAAADLVAETIAQVTADFDPVSAVATVPAWWPAHTVEAQRRALERVGAEDVVLVAEPLAALRRLEATSTLRPDTPVVVYDLGATGTTVSVVGSGPRSGLLGEPVRSTEVSGAEFDLLTMRYVLANALGETDFDPFDPVVERELSVLRNRCAEAKQQLSTTTATMVQVRLAGTSRDVRLVRDELEDLFRDPLTESLPLVREAVRRAGLGLDQVGQILLTGGGAAIGLLTELVSGEFAVPIAPIDDPGSLSARGAALLAGDLYAEQRTDALTPAVMEPAAPQHLSEEDTTTALPAVGGTAIEPPPADTTPPKGPARWRRAAFIAGAAIAVGAVATGTLALGTAGGPSNSTPAPAAATSAANAGSTSGAVPAGATDSAHPSGGAATSAVTPAGAHRSGAAAEHAPGTAAPGTAGPNSADPNSPAPDSPAPGTAAGPGTVANAPAPNAPAPNSPAPDSPAPQAPPQVPVQTPSAPSVPTQPSSPSVPGSSLGNTLGNTLDQTGDTLGTVLQVPGKVIPHEGN